MIKDIITDTFAKGSKVAGIIYELLQPT